MLNGLQAQNIKTRKFCSSKKKAEKLVQFFPPPVCISLITLLLLLSSSVLWCCVNVRQQFISYYIHIFLCEDFLLTSERAVHSVVCALSRSVLQRVPVATTVPTLPLLCSLLLACICASSLSVWLMLCLIFFQNLHSNLPVFQESTQVAFSMML